MPDDRLFHKRLGHSEKVNSLTDFEELVWRAYILSADDFGVMRFSAVTLQADSDRMANKPAKAVQKALERVATVGLIQTFDHQGRRYCYQNDWADWQKVEYPRATINPPPPSDDLSPKTRELFAKHPGGWGKKKPQTSAEHSPNVLQTSAERSEEISPKPLAVSLSREPLAVSRECEPPTLTHRAGEFIEWYQDKHYELFGMGYIGNPQKDYTKAQELCQGLTDAELRDAALVWFGMQDDFATRGNRTIPKFASRVAECVQIARKVSA